MVQNLQAAVHQHFQNIGLPVPIEISAALSMFDILAPHFTLTRHIHRVGVKATESVDSCKAVLEGVELQDIVALSIGSSDFILHQEHYLAVR